MSGPAGTLATTAQRLVVTGLIGTTFFGIYTIKTQVSFLRGQARAYEAEMDEADERRKLSGNPFRASLLGFQAAATK